jgi:hypothetical protein
MVILLERDSALYLAASHALEGWSMVYPKVKLAVFSVVLSDALLVRASSRLYMTDHGLQERLCTLDASSIP